MNVRKDTITSRNSKSSTNKRWEGSGGKWMNQSVAIIVMNFRTDFIRWYSTYLVLIMILSYGAVGLGSDVGNFCYGSCCCWCCCWRNMKMKPYGVLLSFRVDFGFLRTKKIMKKLSRAHAVVYLILFQFSTGFALLFCLCDVRWRVSMNLFRRRCNESFINRASFFQVCTVNLVLPETEIMKA